MNHHNSEDGERTKPRTITPEFKAIACAAAILLGLAAPLTGAVQNTNNVDISVPLYFVGARGPHSAVWQKISTTTNSQGQIISATNQAYVELATGLNHLQNGQWVPSTEEIDVLAGGGAGATNGQHQSYYPSDIYSGEIQLVTPDGKILESRPLGLSFFDGTNSVLIAQLTNSVGQINGNQVIYANAFTGLAADLVYIYTRNSFEQNVVIRSQVPDPASLGLNPATTRLQLLTEFFFPPQPGLVMDTLPDQAGMSLDDEELDFGVMKVGTGRAFLLGTSDPGSDVLVSKTWTLLDNRQFLIEEIPLAAVSQQLKTLPQSPALAALSAKPRFASRRLILPAQRLVKARKGPAMQMARGYQPPAGLILDYSTYNSSQTNLTFQGDTTYYISGGVVLYGTNTFEGGTVLKYDTNGSISLPTSGSPALVWLTSPYRPAVFTAKDDNSVGEAITNSTGTPTNSYASIELGLPNSGNFTIQNARFEYAQRALGSGGTLNLTNVQIINCQKGVSVDTASLTLNLRNVLMANLNTNIDFSKLLGGGSVSAQNVTFVSGSALIGQGITTSYGVTMTNCALVNMTNGFPVGNLSGNYNGFYNSPTIGGHQIIAGSYPFQASGAANYYLTNGGNFTNAGSSIIDPTLLALLKTKTTFPPILLTNRTFTTSTNLNPQALRDTDTPDIGYHYDPIDFLVDKLVITNATLTLTNGVAIATYNDNPGIGLTNNSAIISIGTPLLPNWMVRYSSVQEQPVSLGPVAPALAISINPLHSANAPTGQYRFTKFAAPAGGGSHLYHYLNAFSYNTLTVQDCEFWGGSNYFGGYSNSVATLKNNLFARSIVIATNSGAKTYLSLTNNLFWGLSTLRATPGSSDAWSAFNNEFDSCTILTNGVVFTNGYNGYYNCSARLNPTNANDVLLTNALAYQSSILGTFYQPTNSLLIGKGSTTADKVGLYHYTVTTNQTIEGTNVVAIGYHYVATDANGIPLDGNGDGIPDYIQDANGDGIVNNGETNWGLAILTQPVSQTVPQGTNVTFSVTAAGVPTVTYQWYFNVTNALPGATATSLVISNVEPANVGNYTVVVTNWTGSITSSAARLDLTCDASPSGLVGWWQAESNSVDAVNLNNGLFTNGVTYAAGKIGTAFSFDGTNGLILIPDSQVLKPTNLTVEAWVLFTSLNSYTAGGAPAGQQFLVEEHTSSGYDAYVLYKWRDTVSGKDYFRFGAGNTNTYPPSVGTPTGVQTNGIQTNVWYHIAGVRGSNYIQLYVNGQFAGQSNVVYQPGYGTSPLTFGAYNSPTLTWEAKFSGKLDEVSLYNRPLSSNEISAIYSAGTNGPGKCQIGPVIVTQPASQSGVVGDTTILMVVATGSQPMTYQWYFNGSLIAGINGPVLTLTNVQSSNAGSYYVIVSNPGGSVVSSTANLYVDTCFSSADICLVIDHSGSMSSNLLDGTVKLTAARIAATNFIQNLNFNNDQAALFSFNDTVATNQTLTNSQSLLLKAIGTVTNSTGQTYMASALQSAQTELAGPRHHSYALPVMVFLSDGEPNDLGNSNMLTTNLVLNAATLVKAAGTRLFTIALGTDADINFMQQIASSTNDSFYASSAAQLTNVYNFIASQICRGTNPPPSVQIISPVNQTLIARSNVVITATNTSSASSAPINWVQFFANTTNSLGYATTATNGLYQINWVPPIGGTNVLTALAVATNGQTLSAPVIDYVRNLPSVTITNPLTGQQFALIYPQTSTNLTIYASVTADRANITNVVFYAGAIPIGSTTSGPPYKIIWTTNSGTYSLTAKATDDSGLTGFSFPVIISVFPTNQPPSVYAGQDQTTNFPTALLSGIVSDDGLASNYLAVTWIRTNGPGTVTFGNSNSAITTVTFSTNGTHVFQLTATDGQFTRTSSVTIFVVNTNQPPQVYAGTDQTFVLPAPPATNYVPTVYPTMLDSGLSVFAGFGIDYFIPSNCVIASVDGDTNFSLIASDGTQTPFTSISGLFEEVYISTVRDTNGGFGIGEMFTGNGNPGEIMRIEPNGTSIGTNGVNSNAWVVLPTFTNNGVVITPGLLRGGLWVDRTRVWGGDLIVSTLQDPYEPSTNGYVWRVNHQGQATLVAVLSSSFVSFNPLIGNVYGDTYEGITTFPNDVQKYGPWAGKILVGGDFVGDLYSIDTNGFVIQYNFPFDAEDIRIIPANENFFAQDANGNAWGAPASDFQGVVGDILVATEDGSGVLYRLRWNGNSFDIYTFGYNSGNSWEQVNFAPAGFNSIAQVNYVLLNGVVTDDGQLNGYLTNYWMQVSGPGPVTFDNPAQTNTFARFSLPGDYVLQLIANDGQFTSSSNVTIHVKQNAVPFVDAGTNQTTTSSSITLYGTVRDDGLPYGETNMTWTQVQGPESYPTSSFSPANQAVTTVTFTEAGNYVLRLTVDDGQATNSADVTVTYQAPHLTLTPSYGWASSTNTAFTVTAKLVDVNGTPIANTNIQFQVTGANGVITQTKTTLSDGTTNFTYYGSNPGADSITATMTGNPLANATITKDWGVSISCGSTISSSGSSYECLSMDWPRNPNQIHQSYYYIFSNAANTTITITNFYFPREVLTLRNPSNQIVAVGGAQLTYTLPVSGSYLIESADTFPGNLLDPAKITLSCGSVPPNLLGYVGGTNVPSGGAIVFPQTTPSQTTNVVLVLTNAGAGSLQITNLAIGNTNVFALANPILGTTISSGGSTNLTITFSNSVTGYSQGELILGNTAMPGGYYSVYLSATAFPTGAPPAIQLSSPGNGASFYAPASVPLTAVISPGATNVSYVNFLAAATNGIYNLGSNSFFTAYGTNLLCSLNSPYLPSGDYTISATAVDAIGRTANSSNITIHVLPPITTNKPPVAVTDYVTIFANSHNNVLNVLTNDSDPNGDLLSIIALSSQGVISSSVTTKNGGTVTIINGGQAIMYTPPAGLQGGDGFSYEISDGKGGTAWGSIYVTIFASAVPGVTLSAASSPTNAGAADPLTAFVSPSQYITRIDFFLGKAWIGTVTNGSGGYYTLPWTAVYDPCNCGFTATAYDVFGQYNTSPAINITVTTNGLPGSLTAIIDKTVDTLSTNVFSLTNAVTVRDGIFNLYGRAVHSIAGTNVQWQLGLYTQDGLTLIRDLTPNKNASGYNTNTIGTTGTPAILVTNCDLTAIQNGVYDLKLTVIGGFQMYSADVQFILESGLKLGQFSFSQQDLVVPVNGIPITVMRTYNSLNPNLGDFGYGWTFAINSMDVALDETRQQTYDAISGDDPYGEGESSGGYFSMRVGGGYDVTLNLPSGQRTTFFFYLTNNAPDFYSSKPAWAAQPGVNATLTAIGNPILHYFGAGSQPYWSDNNPGTFNVAMDNYDFQGFILTTLDGTVCKITRPDLGSHSSASGDWMVETYGPPSLSEIDERTGDKILISPNSIVYQSVNGTNQQVTITRNSAGLVSSITDPNGASGGPPAVVYQYDNNNNLIAIQNLVDRVNGIYTTNFFTYTNSNFPHYITGVINANGTPAAQNLYDDSGKLIGLIDANGNRTTFIHNTTNSLDVVVDRLGNTNTYVYDLRGNVTAQTNALTQVTLRSYDSNNNKTNQINYLNGAPYASNSYVYSAVSLLMASTDPLGHTNGFSYDNYGNVLTGSDSLGRTSTNYYNGNGLLIGTSDALGNLTTNVFANGLLTGFRDPIGTVATNYYDGNNNLSATATLSGNTILSSNTFLYDANNNRINSTLWRRTNSVWTASTTTYIYDGQNRMIQTIDPNGGTNTVVYNAIGKQSATIDKLGRVTSYSYDLQGRLSQTTYPDLTTESSAYDPNGNRTNSVDRLGRVTSYVFDPLNRLVQTVYPDNTTNSTVYDDVGRVRFSVDARGVTNAFGYDTAGRCVAVTNAWGVTGVQMVSTFGFDANGNQLYFTNALGIVTTNLYDALNRQTNTTFADGTKQLTVYDAVGRRVASVDQANVTNLFGYDGAGRLTSVTNALNQVTRFQFDEAGNETLQIDALNRTNTYTYDSIGRRITHSMPGLQTESFGYNLVGSMVRYTNFNSAIITNIYDSMNRLTARIYPNGTSNTFTYTATGQRQAMNDASGSYLYAYDSRDRMLTNNGPAGILSYGYDVNGNVTNIVSSTASGTLLTYQYDALNRLTNVLASGSAMAGYGYDAVGNLQAMRYGNGVTNLYQYDAFNRLTNLTWKVNGSARADFSYQLGLAGNRTGLNETVAGTNRVYSWSYDALYRLTNEVVTSTLAPSGSLGYGYDAVGNRTNRAITGFSGVLSLTNQSFSFSTNDWLTTDIYDANGNTRTNASSQPYFYDYENRLTNFNNQIVIVYDADGNRVKKITSTGTNLYLVDTRNPSGYAQVLEELTVSGGTTNLTRSYVYGLDLVRMLTGAVTRYYGYDGQGSVRLLFGPAGGPTDTYVYDAYGTLAFSSGATVNNYLYCGEQWDPDLQQYYLRARTYNPTSGRFWTMDTFAGNNEDPLSLHRYLYASGNPLNGIDPSGHETLIGLSVASTISASLETLYNAVDIFTELALQHTIIGVQNHLTETQIVEGYLKDVAIGVGFGLAIGAAADIAGDLVYGGEIEGEVVEIEVNGANTVEGSRLAAAAESSTEDVMGAASRAANTVKTQNPGLSEGMSGFGTKVHVQLEEEIKTLGGGLRGEVSYKDGIEVYRGKPGSVRLDVVKGPEGKPQAIWDLKTGSAEFTPDRIQQIRANLPEDYRNVPIYEIRLSGAIKTH